MATPVVTVASGGLPVIDVTATTPKLGAPVTEAIAGRGIAVTKVASWGTPVTFSTVADYSPPAGAGSTTTMDSAGGEIAMSNGGLTATRTAITLETGARSTVARSTGKYYFEFTRGISTGTSDSVGIVIVGQPYSSVLTGANCSVIFTNYGPGWIYTNGSSPVRILGAAVVGDVISVAVDLTAHKIWFRKNGGNWNDNATYNPATDVGSFPVASGNFVPVMGFDDNSAQIGNTVTVNFGASAFAYAVPSGFGNW